MARPKSTAKTATQAHNREIVRFAAQLMKSGIADPVIQSKITDMGLNAEQASAIVNTLRQLRKQVRRKSGLRNMIIGGVVCIAGIIITAVTVSSSKGGSVYIVMWGAIMFGALQFFGGAFQYWGK